MWDAMLTIDGCLVQCLGVCATPTTHWQLVLHYLCGLLELSGHGVPWFLLCALLLLLHLLTGWQPLLLHGVNMLTLLVMDVVLVAPIKLAIRRPRPPQNKGTIPLSVSSVDKFSFPSGHTSRCVVLALYFCLMPPFNPHTHLWYVWAAAVSLSRILSGRHYITDVLAGVLAGGLVFELVRRLGWFYGAPF